MRSGAEGKLTSAMTGEKTCRSFLCLRLDLLSESKPIKSNNENEKSQEENRETNRSYSSSETRLWYESFWARNAMPI